MKKKWGGMILALLEAERNTNGAVWRGSKFALKPWSGNAKLACVDHYSVIIRFHDGDETTGVEISLALSFV